MTTTKTCNLMNGYYQILKGCTISEIEQMRAIYQEERPACWRVAVYCCGETIRRKRAGVWA